MDSKRVLSLLGLALRGGNLAVGEEPVEAAARARDARVLLLAGDAAENTCRRAEHFAQAGQCLCLRTPFSREELGAALGRTSVALAAVTDTGLANAVVHRLAEEDPERYAGAAARMELKYKRARERRQERLAHGKNGGKRRAETAARQEKEPPRNPRGAPSRTGGTPYGSKGAPSRGKGARPDAGRGPGRRTGPAPGERSAPPGSSHAAAGRGRTGPGAKPYAHSRPVKKGKGSFRKRED